MKKTYLFLTTTLVLASILGLLYIFTHNSTLPKFLPNNLDNNPINSNSSNPNDNTSNQSPTAKPEEYTISPIIDHPYKTYRLKYPSNKQLVLQIPSDLNVQIKTDWSDSQQKIGSMKITIQKDAILKISYYTFGGAEPNVCEQSNLDLVTQEPYSIYRLKNSLGDQKNIYTYTNNVEKYPGDCGEPMKEGQCCTSYLLNLNDTNAFTSITLEVSNNYKDEELTHILNTADEIIKTIQVE